MTETVRTCADCGDVVERRGTKGRWPTYCLPCVTRRRTGATARWRKARIAEDPEFAAAYREKVRVRAVRRRAARTPEEVEKARARDRENKRRQVAADPVEASRRQRMKRLRATYGLRPGDYERMLEEQEGVCAICRNPEPAGKWRLAVDHCHMTGVVRGLLCQMCNQGLGRFSDDPARLERAAAYLRKAAGPH